MSCKKQQLQLLDKAIARLKDKGNLTPDELQDYTDYIILREQVKNSSESESKYLFLKYMVRLCTTLAGHEIIDQIKDLLE